MSLPHALGLDIHGVGMETPYLTADPVRVERWRQWLGPYPGRTAALVYQGNPKARPTRAARRRWPLLAPVLETDGVRFVCLQKEHGLDQLDGAARRRHPQAARRLRPGRRRFPRQCRASFAFGPHGHVRHRARPPLGRARRPTFLMLKHAPDWRWLFGRADSPWYPSFRLFRQPTAGDWRSVGTMVARRPARPVRRP